MQELIEFMAKKLVGHPGDVQVTQVENEECQTFELRVNPEDMGRIIGKSGRTAKALRTVVGSSAAKRDIEASLEIVE